MSVPILQVPRVALFCSDPIQLARNLIGSPYNYWATLKDAPQVFNCYTLTQLVIYAAFGILLPDYPEYQFTHELCVPVQLDILQPLDLVFTSGITKSCPYDIAHVGLATGGGTIIHATNEYGKTKGGIFEVPLDEFLIRRAYKGARRILL